MPPHSAAWHGKERSSGGCDSALGDGAGDRHHENRPGAKPALYRCGAQLFLRLDTLRRAPEHPHWEDLAARCLGCGACALSCPTCACTDIEDSTGIAGEQAERRRVWSCCYDIDFSLVGEGPVRRSIKSRYRQWLTHKLSNSVDQFGVSGSVGCGRCIGACPVGIDLTAEAAALSGEGTEAPA